MRTNFTNAFAALAGSIEEVILGHTAALADTVGRMSEAILAVGHGCGQVGPARAARGNRSESGITKESKPRDLKPVATAGGESAPQQVRGL